MTNGDDNDNHSRTQGGWRMMNYESDSVRFIRVLRRRAQRLKARGRVIDATLMVHAAALIDRQRPDWKRYGWPPPHPDSRMGYG